MIKLTQKGHIAELDKAGDWCMADTGVVIMACPVCAGIFVCKDHKVEQKNPLTLSPSVVGPNEASTAEKWEVLAPCKHHFFVKEGNAVL